MREKGFGVILLLVIAAVIALIVGIKFYKGKNVQTKPLPSEAPVSSPIKDEHDSLFRSFLNDSYPLYSTLQQEVTKDQIIDVFPLSLPPAETGWIVEAHGETRSGTPHERYFLVTPTLEKELTKVTSTPYDSDDGLCKLDTVKQVSVGTQQYLVLVSTQCNGYGAAGHGSVSIYKLKDGEKIKFHGSTLSGISEAGNAVGILQGIYGAKHPVVVVNHIGLSSGVAYTAYYDLQTGKLNQLIKFQ